MFRFLVVAVFAATTNASIIQAGTPPTEVSPQTKAEGQSGLTDEDRKVVQKVHNDYRTMLANGQAVNKDGTLLPQGANINYLQYDRDVEALAQKWASGCVRGHPPHDQLNGTGQNVWMYTVQINASAALTTAAESWWSELQKVGVNANLTLVGDQYLQIGHWSQMAWAATTKLGCGVQWCENNGTGSWSQFTYVVCNYSPAGNSHVPIYESGPPCSKCSSRTDATNQTACSGSLCNGPQ